MTKIWAGIAGLTFCFIPLTSFAVPTTYVDTHDDQVGSTNGTRDLWSTSIDSDGANLNVQINLNPEGDLNKYYNTYNYAVAITTGSGGDTADNPNTHGNPYDDDVSINQSFGGMTDWIGVFPLDDNGQTIVGFNAFTFSAATSAWTKTQGVNTPAKAIAAGDSVSSQTGYTGVSVLNVVVPMSDFPNMSFTPGSSFSFDVMCIGYIDTLNTAYDSLVDPLPTQSGAFDNRAQFDVNSNTAPNGLDVFTVAAPEPSTFAIAASSVLLLLLRRRKSAINSPA